jgi:hypothetical protein
MLNVMIDNGNIWPDDHELFGFWTQCKDDESGLEFFMLNIEPFIVLKPAETDMFDLLVRLEAFPSKGQARKNWKGPATIPDGWTELFVGKGRRQLCIWNPKVFKE